MTHSRPEILFPLFADLTVLDGVGPKSAQYFAKMDVTRPRDLIFTLPHSCIDRRPRNSLKDLVFPAVATVEIEVGIHIPPTAKGRPYRVMVRDSKMGFQLVFFHAREDWVQRNLPVGQRRLISGKVEVFDGVVQMVHPDHILRIDEGSNLPPFEPVYPLTAGISQKLMTKAMLSALDRAPVLAEWIDPNLKSKQNWPDWQPGLKAAHAPQGAADISASSSVRERLAYDELLAHQITLAIARANVRRSKGLETLGNGSLQSQVTQALPYTPTGAQLRAVEEIQLDMAKPIRMNRLLQGDVGSGKTLVAFMVMLAAVESGGQAAFMAPTEILARQHLAALRPFAELAGVSLQLLTGRDKGADRRRKLDDLASGEIRIMVGTHAIFQKDVKFQHLRLAIIDEQHRFGVQQRMDLGAKGRAVDILVMTATPIPRSLALAHYGDMDISVLDEKPPGRKEIETVMVSQGRLDQVVDRLKAAISHGRQAYWVCPLVEESELVAMTAAADRFKHLRAALGDGVVGLVHGQMRPKDKDQAMEDFISGRTKVLVATTVIEVGVDVPTATIIVIEHAEHFGLAQLHQLRGRVGRGDEASTCLLLYSGTLGETAMARLSIMRETNDGFKIAEEDLKLRGAGDLLGVAQSGLPRFQIADLEAQADLMKIAQDDARIFLQTDPKLATDRGQAIRTLLYLMEQDKAIRLLSIG
ncbi:MAG: ATP-dependent DNA helicase RecG [Paracoccaceae bacterium]|jgi:ATP-dependent DNA helicase RecG